MVIQEFKFKVRDDKLFVICFPLMFKIDKSRYIILKNHLIENLQETACGGTVISTDVRGLRISHSYLGGKLMKNFWKMGDFSLFANSYFYVDHNSYLADALFVQRKIAMKFKGEMVKEDSPYCIIFCKVLKRDVQKFEDALEKLKAKVLLLGYTDYVDVCGEIAALIDKRNEGEK